MTIKKHHVNFHTERKMLFFTRYSDSSLNIRAEIHSLRYCFQICVALNCPQAGISQFFHHLVGWTQLSKLDHCAVCIDLSGMFQKSPTKARHLNQNWNSECEHHLLAALVVPIVTHCQTNWWSRHLWVSVCEQVVCVVCAMQSKFFCASVTKLHWQIIQPFSRSMFILWTFPTLYFWVLRGMICSSTWPLRQALWVLHSTSTKCFWGDWNGTLVPDLPKN